MTQFSTPQIITPAMQETFDARARKLRSDAVTGFLRGLFAGRRTLLPEPGLSQDNGVFARSDRSAKAA